MPDTGAHTPESDLELPEQPVEAAGEPALERKNPREEILTQKGFCTRINGSGCNRCEIVCPHDAITVSDANGPAIDAELCTRCGLCAGICDAFFSARVTSGDLIERIDRLAKEHRQIYFTCNEHIFGGFTQAENVIVLPCLAMLSPEAWTRILSAGYPCYIFLDRSYCASCPTAGEQAQVLFNHAMRTAEAWSGNHFLHAEDIPEHTYLVDEYANAAMNNFDRRNILTSFKDQTLDIASGKRRQRGGSAIQSYHERLERMKARNMANMVYDTPGTVKIGIPSKRYWPRRKLLLDAIDKHPDIASRFDLYQADTDVEACTLEKHCIAACPTGARQLVEESAPEGEQGVSAARIEVDPRLCIACGCCIAACPNGACSYKEIEATTLLKERN